MRDYRARRADDETGRLGTSSFDFQWNTWYARRDGSATEIQRVLRGWCARWVVSLFRRDDARWAANCASLVACAALAGAVRAAAAAAAAVQAASDAALVGALVAAGAAAACAVRAAAEAAGSVPRAAAIFIQRFVRSEQSRRSLEAERMIASWLPPLLRLKIKDEQVVAALCQLRGLRAEVWRLEEVLLETEVACAMPPPRGRIISGRLRQALACRKKRKIDAARRAHCVAVVQLHLSLQGRYSEVWAEKAAAAAAAEAARAAWMAAAAAEGAELDVAVKIAHQLLLRRRRQPGPRAAAVAARVAASAGVAAGEIARTARYVAACAVMEAGWAATIVEQVAAEVQEALDGEQNREQARPESLINGQYTNGGYNYIEIKQVPPATDASTPDASPPPAAAAAAAAQAAPPAAPPPAAAAAYSRHLEAWGP